MGGTNHVYGFTTYLAAWRAGYTSGWPFEVKREGLYDFTLIQQLP